VDDVIQLNDGHIVDFGSIGRICYYNNTCYMRKGTHAFDEKKNDNKRLPL
jgi:hypothetical protein